MLTASTYALMREQAKERRQRGEEEVLVQWFVTQFLGGELPQQTHKALSRGELLGGILGAQICIHCRLQFPTGKLNCMAECYQRKYSD